jgi:hypothetical protein
MVVALMRALDADLARQEGQDREHLAAVRQRLTAAVSALAEAGEWIVANYGSDVRAVSAGAVPFLRLFGVVAGGWQMARAALVASEKIAAGDDDPFYRAKIASARFFADHLLVQAGGLSSTVITGAGGVMALADDQF